MGILLKGYVSFDYLVTGAVVSLIVASIIIFLLKLTMQIRLDNEVLKAEVEKERITSEDLSRKLDFQSLLIETIPDLLFVLSPDGSLIKWNEKAVTATGYTAEELSGMNGLSLIAEEDRDKAQSGLEEARSVGTSNRELHLLTKDGNKVFHLFSGAGMKDVEGHFLGYIGVAKNLSRFRKLEEETNLNQKLESVGILAGRISHEFNDLLTSILENIHLAVIHSDQRDILRGYLITAQETSTRVKDLNNQLFAFARAGFPIKELVEIGAIIKEAAGPAILHTSAACEFRIAEDLWRAEIDKVQFCQALKNIILNAAEAMPGGGTVTITAENVDVAPDDLPLLSGCRYIRISVADEGSGIFPEAGQKIFDPFFSSKRHRSGLGLSMSHAILKNHGGLIQVDSEPGKGSVFHIYLPAASCRKGPASHLSN
jgi:PAS domain S-box-containing protein